MQLTKEDFEQIKIAINTYNQATPTQRQVIAANIERVWSSVNSQYTNLCSQDKEWTKLTHDIDDYETVISFNMAEHFRKNVGPVNPNNTEIAWEYDEPSYQQHVDAQKHIESFRKKINQEIKTISNKKSTFNEDAQITHLKERLNKMENMANKFTTLKAQEKLKSDYLKTKTKTYAANQSRLQTINENLATQVIYNVLKTNPEITCVEHHSTAGNTNDSILDSICNQIRDEVLQTIAQATETMQSI